MLDAGAFNVVCDSIYPRIFYGFSFISALAYFLNIELNFNVFTIVVQEHYHGAKQINK